METTIKFARKNKDVILPSKRLEDAGLDIYAYFEENCMVIQPHETKLIPTGLYSCCTSDYSLLAWERGSTGSIGLKVSAGCIDSGYRGEIFIALTNTNDIPISITKEVDKTNITEDFIEYPYTKGIAQLLVVPVPRLTIEELTVEQLQEIPSQRGDGSLGSSNK